VKWQFLEVEIMNGNMPVITERRTGSPRLQSESDEELSVHTEEEMTGWRLRQFLRHRRNLVYAIFTASLWVVAYHFLSEWPATLWDPHLRAAVIRLMVDNPFQPLHLWSDDRYENILLNFPRGTPTFHACPGDIARCKIRCPEKKSFLKGI
jgi:hypothetical protein